MLPLDAAQRLDPGLLPPLLLAWHGEPGESSGDVHAPVFARFEAGDQQIRATMEQLAQNADAGRDALLAGDHEAFRGCVDRNFDLRAGVFPIAPCSSFKRSALAGPYAAVPLRSRTSAAPWWCAACTQPWQSRARFNELRVGTL